MNQRPFFRLFRSAVFLVFLFLPTVLVLRADSSVATVADPQLARAAEHLRANRNQEALQALQTAQPSGQRSLMAGEALLRLKRYEEALPHLTDAERTYPLLADIALSLRAEALFNLKRFSEAFRDAEAAARTTPLPSRSRRMEKLAADALFADGDLKGALAAYRRFTTRYPLGSDHVDALLQSAQCFKQLGDRTAAVQLCRTIWLTHPAAPQAEAAWKLLKELAAQGVAGAADVTPEEQYSRGRLLLANNQPATAAWAFSALQREGMSDEFAARVDLAAGQAALRQRHYALAEPLLKRAAGSQAAAVRDEARLLLARLEERQGAADKALARYLTLGAERGPLADDALLGAALVHKHAGRFAEASLLLERLLRELPTSDQAGRAGWELAWGRYLSGNLEGADGQFRALLKQDAYRERSLYWLARINERRNRPQDAGGFYATLLQEYPFGFYAAWHRGKSGTPAPWEPLPAGLPEPELPSGSQRIQALAELGILDEARAELAPLKTPGVLSAAQLPGLARLQQLAGDFHGSILTFHQNRPATWERSTLPFWRLGYPRHYADLIRTYSTTYKLPESLVLALTKAESSFRADVKSHAGAIGLMQLMPATARLTAGYKGKEPYNPLRLIDPEHNISLGTKHLRELLDQYRQDTVFALAAYNAGGGAVKRWRTAFGHLERDEFIENIPYQETRDYVKKIVAAGAIYQALYKIP